MSELFGFKTEIDFDSVSFHLLYKIKHGLGEPHQRLFFHLDFESNAPI